MSLLSTVSGRVLAVGAFGLTATCVLHAAEPILNYKVTHESIGTLPVTMKGGKVKVLLELRIDKDRSKAKNWDWIGGTFDAEKDATIIDAFVRKADKEIGPEASKMLRVAESASDPYVAYFNPTFNGGKGGYVWSIIKFVEPEKADLLVEMVRKFVDETYGEGAPKGISYPERVAWVDIEEMDRLGRNVAYALRGASEDEAVKTVKEATAATVYEGHAFRFFLGALTTHAQHHPVWRRGVEDSLKLGKKMQSFFPTM